MLRALELSLKGIETGPNPRVGCVLVRDEKIIGEGWHAVCGGPHAEVAALDDAASRGFNAVGATAYVTLEPCSHFGRTPPCAPRLVKEGVSRVVIGMMDPNPIVNGKGAAILREAGVELLYPFLEDKCKWINRGFIRHHAQNRPWVTLKAGLSLDGMMALENGKSKWITGPEARTEAHVMRAEHDGILVGIGTLMTDDPELTARLPERGVKSPLRVLLDSKLQAPLSAKMFRGGAVVLTSEREDAAKSLKKRALSDIGVEVAAVPEDGEGRLDLSCALKYLADRGVQRLLVEGGGVVHSAFLSARLADAVSLFYAPKFMGRGMNITRGLKFDDMDDAITLREMSARAVGRDILIEGILSCSPDL